MAGGALGSLTVKLGLDAAEFTGGLSKADHEAKKFSENVGRVIGQGLQLAAASFTAFAAAGTAAFLAADKLISQAADYQDMAEKINGSAEAIASYGVALGTAGTSTETLIGAQIKLAKGLTGVDDESKAAGAAIAALGLNLGDFKKLKPEEQIDAVAKAMAGFADTSDKTAIAVALFGKSGAELLPFLKALEEQGGRQVILTAEQIAQADEYADKVARVSAEFKQQAQAVATQLIPVMSDIFDIVADLAKAFTQSESAATLFGIAVASVLVPLQTIAIVGANVAFVFVGVGREIGAVTAQLAALARGDIDGFKAISTAVKEDGVRARAELDAFEKRVLAVGQRTDLSSNFDDSGARAAGRPRLDFQGADASAKKAASAAKSALADAERYIEALRKQDEKTEHLTATEKVLADIQAGRFKEAGKFTEGEALRLAGEIDASKELVLQIKARRDAVTAEGDAILKANTARQDSIKQMLDATPSAKLEKSRADAQLLTEEFEAGRLSEEKYLEAVTTRFDLVAKNLEKTDDTAKQVGLTFSSAFEDAIVKGGKLSDIVASLGQDLLKLALRKSVTEPLFNAVSGSGIFDSIGKLFGGGKAAGGPVAAGKLYRVNENQPEMLDVNGSQYLMMGSKGGTVRPGSQAGAAGSPIVINVGAGASRADVISAVQRGIATSVGLVAQSNRRRGPV